MRPFCYACRRASVMCICESVTPVPSRTRVVILQHDEESWNQIGTAALAHRGLPNSALIVAREFQGDPRLAEELARRDRETVLLYPAPGALPLRPGEDVNLVVIDGTWAQARAVVNHTPELASLRRVRLEPGEKSRYRIRLQPRAECVSTIEAAVRALETLEGECGKFQPLIDAFDRMIDRQIELARAAGRSIIPDLVARRAGRPLVPELSGKLEELVIVQGETLWFYTDANKTRTVDLVQWEAVRLGTGERFSAIVAPPRAVAPSELAYLELREEDLARGTTREALASSWRSFAKPGDVYVSWGWFAPNALAEILGAPLARAVDLRHTTKFVSNKKVRRPEDALVELDVPAPPPLGPGRAGRRLPALASIVSALRAGRGLATLDGSCERSAD